MRIWMKGNAWYTRKTVEGTVRDLALGVYGEDRKSAAEKAAKKLLKDIDDKNAATRHAKRIGVEPPTVLKGAEPVTVPTLAEWWARVKALYPGPREHRIMAVWLKLPFEMSTWGQTPLDMIKKSHCLHVLAVRRQQPALTRSGKSRGHKVAEGTVRRERVLVQAVIQRAVDDDIIAKNPWTTIERGRDQARHRLLSPDEQDRLLVELKPRQARWVEFVIETGLRLEGARELKANLVREIDGEVYAHVSEKAPRGQHSVCAICGREDRKCREVPLTTRAQWLIQVQLDSDGALWAAQTGMASISLAMVAAAKRANIPHRVSPHDLRHTFGHRWLVRGGDIYILSKLLGHSSVRITEQHYAYLLKENLATKMRAVMEPQPALTA